MNYNRDNFKLSINKDRTQFFVNEKKGIVSCVISAALVTPYNWDGPVCIPDKIIKTVGVAKCSSDDVFDAERGKRIALAKAENKAYLKAITYLNELFEHLIFFIDRINSFSDKGLSHCAHNVDYMESIHNPEHPMYKVTINPMKHGYTNGKPNFYE